MKAKSTTTELNQVNVDTMLTPISVSNEKPSQSATVECRPTNKKTTSTGKFSIFEKDSQKPRSSKTSAVDSTISVKGLKPFWNEQCEEINSRLWLPTETDSVGLDLNSSSKSSNFLGAKSWFSKKVIFHPNKNLPQTFSASFTSSAVGSTALEVTKVKSVRLYPTKEQREVLRQWFGVSRYSYNYCMSLMRDHEGEKKPSWMDVKLDVKNFPEWAKSTPFQVKGIAIKEAHKAFWDTLKATSKNKAKPGFRFRSRKEPTQSIFIPKSAIKTDSIYPRALGKMKMRGGEIPEVPLDSRLVHSNGEYHLKIPYKQTVLIPENQGKIVALDPGVRTFQTFFSESSCGSFGYDDFGRIQRLCHYLDDLISRTSKAKGRQRYKMRQSQKKMRIKIKNLITELHCQVANYLTKEFDVILLPTFETSNMAKKGKRKLRRKSVRAMLTWSHYAFKMRLKNKAIERGKTVIDVCEAYTSKTCSWTGEILNVGGSRVIRSGEIELDRDLNGARNIFIRSLVDSPTLMSAVVPKHHVGVW